MSEEKQENPEAEASDLLGRINPVILVSVAVGATLVALLAMISLVLLLSLASDVSHLEDQMRKLNKAAKTMEQDLGEIRTSLTAPTALLPGEEKPKSATARPTHIDTADPASDCVIRSGSKGGLANCLK